MGQQNLRGVHAMLLETGLVSLHQPHLPDGCRGLQFGDITRRRLEPEPLDAFRNRTRRHQHHFGTLLAQQRHLFRPGGNHVTVDSLPAVGNEGGTNLDHNLVIPTHPAPENS